MKKPNRNTGKIYAKLKTGINKVSDLKYKILSDKLDIESGFQTFILFVFYKVYLLKVFKLALRDLLCFIELYDVIFAKTTKDDE